MAERFKLQSVLNYRQSLEDQAQQQLAATQQQRRDTEERVQERQQAMQSYDRELRRRQQEGLTVAEMELFESRIQDSRRQIEAFRQQLQLLDRRIADQRKHLLDAARERQVIEKLRDKQNAEYQRELSRKERAMLDEISLRNQRDPT
jgi:flagellar FliJ protein